MNTHQAAEFLSETYRRLGINTPSVHIVLGSGFAPALSSVLHPSSGDQSDKKSRDPSGQDSYPSSWTLRHDLPFTEMPGLPAPTVQGHGGSFKIIEHRETRNVIIIQAGRLHGYEGHAPKQVIHPVMASRLAGTSTFILTNAAGSLTEEFGIGSLMLLTDHFNFTGMNPLTGPNPLKPDGKPIGARFPDMSEVYEEKLRKKMRDHLRESGLSVHEGIYLGLLGPSYETPAEISIFAKWGAHTVGMSTVWEAIALKHSGARIAGMSLVSNLACGIGGVKHLDHEDVLIQCSLSATKILKGLLSFLEKEFQGA